MVGMHGKLRMLNLCKATLNRFKVGTGLSMIL